MLSGTPPTQLNCNAQSGVFTFHIISLSRRPSSWIRNALLHSARSKSKEIGVFRQSWITQGSADQMEGRRYGSPYLTNRTSGRREEDASATRAWCSGRANSQSVRRDSTQESRYALHAALNSPVTLECDYRYSLPVKSMFSGSRHFVRDVRQVLISHCIFYSL